MPLTAEGSDINDPRLNYRTETHRAGLKPELPRQEKEKINEPKTFN
jgi:hypothetical protein